jgi:dTDP-4-dehydrorhamnose reductase
LPALIVFGAAGQLGDALVRAARAAGLSVVALTRAAADITREEELARVFAGAAGSVPAAADPGLRKVVLNAAAYTDVDRAEAQPHAANAVNERGAALLAAHCAARGIPLIHFSSDYVFDGNRRTAYAEDDATAPVNAYGASKLAGEAAVRAACPQHVILRCSTVFSAHGRNFLTAVLQRARQPGPLVVSDQRGSPTPVEAIADAALRLAREAELRGPSMPFGTYHFAGEPPATRYEFAQAIFDAAAGCSLPQPRLQAIAAAEVQSAARRPANSALSCEKIRRTFGIASPDWRRALSSILPALL